MAELLYLTHRLPYPPNKGDKVRSYHLLEHLAARHRVFLGTFIDDPDDEAHVDAVRALCAGLHVARIAPARARLRSLGGLPSGQPLTLGYYRDAGLAAWVAQTLARPDLCAALVFSSSMAQYVEAAPDLPVLVDFVDVDSAKWSQYAERSRWPLSWLYRREGVRLLAYERAVAERARRSFFVTDGETALFRQLAPECGDRVEALCNGVDGDYFAPDPGRASPFADGVPTVVFTGAMDYRPNIDAVSWFARAVLPALRARWPRLEMHVVGRNPPRTVRALESEALRVSGTVPDVRPYLQHASVVVAPLLIARGIQNKVLEAMAMARPVVASAVCARGVQAQQGSELLAAESVDDYVQLVDGLLREPARAAAIGQAGRRRVLAAYSWPANLSRVDACLEAAAA